MDWFLIIAALIKIFAMIAIVLGIATLLTWVERKQSAVMADRLGANRADIFGIRIIGLFQPIADAIKMITKEDFIPSWGDKKLHMLAPAISFAAALMIFAVIPLGPPLEIAGRTIKMQIADIDMGILLIFAFGGLGVYGAVLGGWSSKNKYTMLAAVRASSQMISYEVCLGLSLIGAIMVYGTLDMTDMVIQQSGYWFGWIPRWGLFLQPLALFIYLPAAMAENKRVPFDLPECESEIIGYFTEYSGLKGGLYMFTEFIEAIIMAAIFSVIFLGGWQIPWLSWDGFHWPWGGMLPVASWLVKLLQFGSLFIKIAIMIYINVLIRWTLPRFRYDQLMRLGWKYLLPLALLNLLITGVVIAVL